MALTAEQLQKYWEANPQALEQAIASNPGMFGLTSQTSPATNGMGDDGFQIGATTAPDIYTGVPGAATQRDPTAQPVDFVSELLRLNEQYTAKSDPRAQFVNAPATFDINEWLAEDKTRTPQQAYEQGLFKLGGTANTPGLATFGDLGQFQTEQRADYADQLNQLLQSTGRGLVEERDGQLYALNTGQDERFKNINAVPIGYEFAENVPVGEYGRIQEKDKDHFLDFVKPLTTGILQAGTMAAGGALLAPLGVGTAPAAAITNAGIQAATTGSIDPTEVLKAGAFAGLGDYIGDAFQTGRSVEELERLRDIGILSEVDFENAMRLRNTSDVGNLFGPNGLFGGDYITTAPLNAITNAIVNSPVTDFLANNPVSQTLFELADPAIVRAVNASLGYDFQDPANQAKLEADIRGGFRYDERFTGADNPRSSDVFLPGVFEENPRPTQPTPTTSPTAPSSGGSEATEETLPERETSISQSIFDTIQELLSNRGKMTDEDLEVDQDLFEGTIPENEKETTTVADSDLPDTGDTELPEQEGPLGMWGVDYTLPNVDVPVLPPSDSTGTIEDKLPSSGGGGGGSGGAGTGMMGMSPKDAEDFMSGITYILPIIQQLNIPLEDFMAMWMNRK